MLSVVIPVVFGVSFVKVIVIEILCLTFSKIRFHISSPLLLLLFVGGIFRMTVSVSHIASRASLDALVRTVSSTLFRLTIHLPMLTTFPDTVGVRAFWVWVSIGSMYMY